METSSDKQKNVQGTQNQIASELSKAREEKRILEMRAGYWKTSRLNLYQQWKEGKIKKEEYLTQKEELSEREAECRQKLDTLNKKLRGASFDQIYAIEGLDHASLPKNLTLTKELADALIERIDVYEDDRIEVKWKFQDIVSFIHKSKK